MMEPTMGSAPHSTSTSTSIPTAAIDVQRLRVRYPRAEIDAVRSFPLSAAAGEVVVIAGPNGSGKTTGLKALAGILTAQELDVRSTGTPAYVHQDPYMLHRRVYANIAYGLAGMRLPRVEVRCRVTAVARRCAVDHLLRRPAHLLSGGQRHRVAIARALVLGRDVLLLDEPTANLDATSRRLVGGIVRGEAAMGRTVIIASHDEPFARSVGDRFFRMDAGVLIPEHLNVLPAVVEPGGSDNGSVVTVTWGDDRKLVGVAGHDGTQTEPWEAGTAVRVVFRPEDVVLSTDEVVSSALNEAPLRVFGLTDHGSHMMVELRHVEGLLVGVDDGRGERVDEGGGDSTRAIVASVSHRSVERLGIACGTLLFASVKATSVRIYREFDVSTPGDDEVRPACRGIRRDTVPGV